MIHEILQVGVLSCNCSIFGDEQSREAIVVDPGDDIPAIQAVLAKHGLKVKLIVITHAHIDHIGGAAKLKKLTGAPVLMNAADQFLYDRMDMQAAWIGTSTPEQTQVEGIREGDAAEAGSLRFEVLETPGHTPGSICLWMPAAGLVVAGDTLFQESIGRTDLPGGDGSKIVRSIRDKLYSLPEETVVVPGHGSKTTIGYEIENNPLVSGRAGS